MPEFTPEQIEAIRLRKETETRNPLLDIGSTALRYAERGGRVVGRGVELAAALNPLAQISYKYLGDKIRPESEMLPFEPPSRGDVLRGLGAGWSALLEGDGIDVDAALAAYEEEAPAGWGYRGATELAGAFVPTGGPFVAGGKLLSASPKLAGTLGRMVPSVARPTVEAGIRGGLTGLGKAMRAPWQAEEAVGRGVVKGLGLGARGLTAPFRYGLSKLRGGEESARLVGAIDEPPVEDLTSQQIIDADEILDTRPATIDEAPMPEDMPEAGWGPPERRPIGVSPYEGTPIKEVDVPIRGGRTEPFDIDTPEGIGQEIRNRKKLIQDEKKARNRAQKGGAKRKVIATYDSAIANHQREIDKFKRILDEQFPIPEEIPVTELPSSYFEKIINQEEWYKVLQEKGVTQEEFIELAGRDAFDVWMDPYQGIARDILDVGTTTRERTVARITEIIKRARKGPSNAEAQLGPNDISLDPRSGFGASPSLSRWSRAVNLFSHLLPQRIKPRLRTEEVEGVLQTAQRVKADVKSRTDSHANTLGIWVRQAINVFEIDPKTGDILDEALQGSSTRVEVIINGTTARLQSPTIQDIAARYSTYRPLLTDGQKEFMDSLRNIVENGTTWDASGVSVNMPGWNRVFREGIEGWDPKRIRPDIEEGGFYLSRGKGQTTDGTNFSITEELDDLIQLGKEVGPRGPLAAERQARMPAMGKIVDAKGNVIARDSYEPFEKTLPDYVKGVGDRIADTNIETRVKELAATKPGKKKINVPGFRDISADDPLASAIERELRDPAWSRIVKAPIIRAVNNTYRALKSTWDLSALGIHGSLAIFRHPALWGQAARISIKALARGQKIADESITVFDTEATEAGRLSSRVWASLNLRIGGADIETAMPFVGRLAERGVEGNLLKKAVATSFRRSNIAFGSFGDILRLRWADDMLRHELSKGKTIKEMFDTNELQDIAEIANKMTGWSSQRFGGDIGELVMFAPRFFSARVETVAQALLGVTRVRPPTMESLRTATRPRVNMPFRGRPFIESDVLSSIGRSQTAQSKEALHTIIRMIGWGVTATEIFNALAGRETDRRPIVNGRPNPNFYTIKLLDRDFNIFGPQIGLLHAIATLGTSMMENPTRPDQAILKAQRSVGSGISRLLWDTITGYDFRGRPTTFGFMRMGDDPEGFVAGPDDILRHIADLSLPIATGAVGAELWETGKAAVEGDPMGIVGGLVGGVAETIGGRVTEFSRSDWQNEIAQREFGKAYDQLDLRVQAHVDELVTEQEGPRSYTGAKGHLYKRKDEVNDALIMGLHEAAGEHLSAPFTSEKFNPIAARTGTSQAIGVSGYNELREIRGLALFGTWNNKKQRFSGGLYEKLYDRDKPREEPEENTTEHLLWRYYQIFEEAQDEKGNVNYDKLELIEDEFWNSLSNDEIDTMAANIRVLEEKYPEQYKKLANAGRYARSIKLEVRGQVVNYWDINTHPQAIRAIADDAEVDWNVALEYINMPTYMREGRHKSEEGSRLQRALSKASRKDGVIYLLRKEFKNLAPAAWQHAMIDAGYDYQGRSDFQRDAIRFIKKGEFDWPDYPYEDMYIEELKRRNRQ